MARDADDKAVTAAFHAAARAHHPDLHPEATLAEQADHQAAMVRINAAYAAIRSERRGATPPPQDAGQTRDAEPPKEPQASRSTPPPSREHPPTLHQCMFCGAEPVSAVRFEYVQAYVLRSTRSRIEGPMCRSCGRAMGRAAQNRTLMTGWWGIRAFFANFVCVLSNAVALQRLRGLPLARRLDDEVASPLVVPMDEGRSVFARPGPYVAVVAFVIVGAILANSSRPPQSGSGGSSNGDAVAVADWSVGNCVAVSPSDATPVAPVPCAETHEGEIVAVLETADDCRAAITSGRGGYVDRDGKRYCVDEAR